MSVSEVASKLSSSGVPIHDFCCNFCSACAVTVVFFGHLDRSLYLLTLLCLTVMLHASVLCCVAGVFACSLRATVLWWSIVLMVSCMRCSGTVKTFHQHCSLAGLNRLQPEWVTYILTRSYIATSSHPSQSTYLCLSVCLPLCLSVCLSLCLYLLWSQAGFKTTGFTKNPHLQVFITFRCDLSLFVGKFGFIVGFWTRIARCCHIKWEVD